MVDCRWPCFSGCSIRRSKPLSCRPSVKEDHLHHSPSSSGSPCRVAHTQVLVCSPLERNLPEDKCLHSRACPSSSECSRAVWRCKAGWAQVHPRRVYCSSSSSLPWTRAAREVPFRCSHTEALSSPTAVDPTDREVKPALPGVQAYGGASSGQQQRLHPQQQQQRPPSSFPSQGPTDPIAQAQQAGAAGLARMSAALSGPPSAMRTQSETESPSLLQQQSLSSLARRLSEDAQDERTLQEKQGSVGSDQLRLQMQPTQQQQLKQQTLVRLQQQVLTCMTEQQRQNYLALAPVSCQCRN